MRSYKYLIAPKYEYSKKDVLSENVNVEKTFNVFDISTRRYLSFDTWKSYYNYAATIAPEKRTFHEVIFGHRPQKFKFDLDIKTRVDFPVLPNNSTDGILALDAPEDKDLNCLLREIVDAIQTMFYITYCQNPKIIICDSREANSYHIILDGVYAESNIEPQNFTRILLGVLPPEITKYIDIGVNKSKQNFRILGCCKPDNVRHVKTTRDEIAFENTLITYTENCVCVAPTKSPITNIKSPIQTSTVSTEQVKKIAMGVAEKNGSVFWQQIGNIFIYRRVRSSHCDLCGRSHDHDNTLLIFLLNGGLVKASCRRELDKSTISFPARFIDVGRIDADDEMQFITQYKAPNMDVKIMNTFANCQKQLYDSAEMQEFALGRTMFIRANMKMGKTNKLKNLINTHFSDPNANIVFISFRQTFSSNIKQRFPDMTLYSDVSGPLVQHKKIVQVESLHRIPVFTGTDVPDLLILDESESIIEQFSSGLLKNFNGSFAVFNWLMRYSKYVICMDALMGERTYNVVSKFRGPEKCIFHYNMYKNATEDRYELLTKQCFIAKMLQDLGDGKRICCPVSSLTFAKALYAIIQTRFPSKTAYIYSSETMQSVKKAHFSDINKKWVEYDVLIYTPTISAGLSFECDHFDAIYAYFTHFSCPVETCIQMLGRVRNVKDHQYNICIEYAYNNMPTERADILKKFSLNREMLSNKLAAEHLTFEYAENGTLQYRDDAYLTMWVENVRVKNLSFNNFIFRFIDYIKATGASCKMMSSKETCKKYSLEDIKESFEDFNNHKSIAKNDKCKNIAQSKELTTDEVYCIQEKIQMQEDIPLNVRHAYEKYKMRIWYKFTGIITDDFVEKYEPYAVRLAYKNLARLLKFDTFAELLRAIQSSEQQTHTHLMSREDRQIADIFKNYTFNTHRTLFSIYEKLGIKKLTDAIPTVDNIDLGELKNLCVDVRISPRITKNTALRVLNECSMALYQISIVRDQLMFKLQMSELFAMKYDCTKPCFEAAPIDIVKAVYEDVGASDYIAL